MGWRGTNLCLYMVLGVLSATGVNPLQAQEAVPEELPMMCYAAEQKEGMPARYVREALITQPELQQRVDPEYPNEPTVGRGFFCAVFSFAVDGEGKPVDVETLYNSHPGLDGVDFAASARDALMQWEFQPGTTDLAPARFVGLSAVFFKGYGDIELQHVELAQKFSSASHRVEGDVAASWQTYGSSVSQSELEILEMAEAEQISPEEAAARIAAAPAPAQPVVYNSWVVAEDGAILTDDGIIPPEQELFAEDQPLVDGENP